MAIHIKAPHEVAPVEFVLPVEDGEPITFGIRPLDYLDRKVLTEYKEWTKKNTRLATEDEFNLKLIELALEHSGADKSVYEAIASYPPAIGSQIIESLAAKSEAKMGKS